MHLGNKTEEQEEEGWKTDLDFHLCLFAANFVSECACRRSHLAILYPIMDVDHRKSPRVPMLRTTISPCANAKLGSQRGRDRLFGLAQEDRKGKRGGTHRMRRGRTQLRDETARREKAQHRSGAKCMSAPRMIGGARVMRTLSSWIEIFGGGGGGRGGGGSDRQQRRPRLEADVECTGGEDRGGGGAWGELQSYHEAEGIEVVKQQDNRAQGHELTDSARVTSTVKRSGGTKISSSGKSSPKSRNQGTVHSGQSDAEQPETTGSRVRIEGVFEVECNATSYKTTKTKQDKKRASDAYARLTQPAGEQPAEVWVRRDVVWTTRRTISQKRDRNGFKAVQTPVSIPGLEMKALGTESPKPPIDTNRGELGELRKRDGGAFLIRYHHHPLNSHADLNWSTSGELGFGGDYWVRKGFAAGFVAQGLVFCPQLLSIVDALVLAAGDEVSRAVSALLANDMRLLSADCGVSRNILGFFGIVSGTAHGAQLDIEASE
ncbi:hypothetical protein K438DRAFT_1943815 [Mycena galopus ATCC 62051]|nr:hypothetical protein K438DRAFT_1943815 [Mycena galopus ATCC 62051]